MSSLRKIAVVASVLGIAALLYHFVFDVRSIRIRNFETDTYLAAALTEPLPSGITAVQGTGETWQGLNCFFRFRADLPALEEHLLSLGFKEKNLPDDALDRRIFLTTLKIPAIFESGFDPPWKPIFTEKRRFLSKHHPDGSTSKILLGTGSEWVHVWLQGA